MPDRKITPTRGGDSAGRKQDDGLHDGETKCLAGKSRLTIPNDIGYIGPALAFVSQIASAMGFKPDAVKDIEAAVREAATNVIRHAFSPHEKAFFHIGLERITLGLKIIVREKGLPFDPKLTPEISRRPSSGKAGGGLKGFSLINSVMDEFSFHNLGMDGKEVHLVKYLNEETVDGRAPDTCLMFPPREDTGTSEEAGDKAGQKGQTRVHARLITDREAVEVARSAYSAYGYTYPKDHIYFPDRIRELIRDGKMISAVPVTEDGQIMGHCALVREGPSDPVAEMATAFVKQEFRAMGALGAVSGFLIREARKRGIRALFVVSVTHHPYSQKVAQEFGFKDCCLQLCLGPRHVRFKKIAVKGKSPISMVTSFLPLEPLPATEVYLPEAHEAMIREIFRHIDVPILQKRISPESSRLPDVPPVVRVENHARKIHANITVFSHGRYVVEEVGMILKSLCLEGKAAINLYLDLSDPATAAVAEQYEKLGFFFSGIMPGANGHQLVLQYLNNVRFDYDAIQMESQFGKKLLNYVRNSYPG